MATEAKSPIVETKADVAKYSALPVGSYVVGVVAVDTDRNQFVKDGKTMVIFSTVISADGGLYELSFFASDKDEGVTSYGEKIERYKAGQKILIRRNPPRRDKASGRAMVEKLFGDVVYAA